jgi:hypothetical protein
VIERAANQDLVAVDPGHDHAAGGACGHANVAGGVAGGRRVEPQNGTDWWDLVVKRDSAAIIGRRGALHGDEQAGHVRDVSDCAEHTITPQKPGGGANAFQRAGRAGESGL